MNSDVFVLALIRDACFQYESQKRYSRLFPHILDVKRELRVAVRLML